jgi:uncharacterized membrane protein YgaE (UPF0421/DUF939 family)
MKKSIDKRAFRKSFWSSLSRVIGVTLSAGAGSIIHRMVGDGIEGWTVALTMAIVSFLLMLYAEYERSAQ